MKVTVALSDPTVEQALCNHPSSQPGLHLCGHLRATPDDLRQREHYAFWVEVEAHDEVSEWLAGLGEAEWDRVAVVIDRLGQLGHRARMPLSRSLGGGLFELRLSLGATARRITYRFTSDGRIVLLTTFRKQRDNERTEVARAHRVAHHCEKDHP